MSYKAGLAATLLVLAPLAGAQKSASEIPVESFFRRAQFAQMELSPDATRLAAVVPRLGRDNLIVIDLDGRAAKVITGYEKFDVASFRWVSNTRLCYVAADGQEATGEPSYKGSACLDHDGGNYRPGAYHQPLALARDGSGDFFVMTGKPDARIVQRYNAATGRLESLTFDTPPGIGMRHWVLDQENVPRVGVSVSSNARGVVWHRKAVGAPWEKLIEFNANRELYAPLAFDFDGKTLYLATDAGRDKRAIFKYDTEAKAMGELVFEHPLVDATGPLVFDRAKKKLVGIRYNGDVPGTKWLDPALDKLQKSIDVTFPKTFNIILFPAESIERWALIRTFAGDDPGRYYLLDVPNLAIQNLAPTREWLDPQLLAPRKFITYKARDGMEIPAWVTIPKDANGRKLPLVVHVHGGPYVRGYTAYPWGRWPVAEFLASRGYVVLEPEPRGSTGYGRKLYRGGFKQWGQAMQDDITDGAMHLVDEGIVDKDRMCLHGGSYGGYATLMGLVKDPDLWRCGAATVAVTSLFLLQGLAYSDMAAYTETASFKNQVGDSVADKEMFEKYSPSLHADRIKAPVLLAMGSEDRRVPLAHGKEMRDALRAAGKSVEFVIYSGEAHGFNKDENVFDFYKRLEKFLAEHLKPAQ